MNAQPDGPKTTEPSFNIELGHALRAKHPLWLDRIGTEQTDVFSEGRGLRPDILIRHPNAMPVVVETEFAPAPTVETDARSRLGKTLQQDGEPVEQALAVRIPSNIAHALQHELQSLIVSARFEYCIFSGNPTSPERWPVRGWIEGGIDDLADCIEQSALSENRLAQGMQILEHGIGQTATILRESCTNRPAILKKIASQLHQNNVEQTHRMAMAILANAMTFHTSIAGAHEIETLDEIRGESTKLPKRPLLDVWEKILTHINYWPIFRIASDILKYIPNGTAQRILDRLAKVASELDSLGATSQHDLCGRMFQLLIADRKFLATFYTLPSSAALLAELSVSRLDVAWSNPEAPTSLRIADFACGTGALLNASYRSVLSRFRRTGQNDRDIHPKMMENVLVGTDIMPAATHLTASILSSAHPSVPFENTSIITLPYGDQTTESGLPVALGALDLIADETTMPLFGTGQDRVRGKSGSPDPRAELPHDHFNLVIMNPPFTRPTNHESTDAPIPSFAGFSTSHDEQTAMRRRLRKISKPDMAGHGNAGLASNFIDIGHAKLKTGGILALVLPGSFLSGAAWGDARLLLHENYKDITIVSLANQGNTTRAFSADTGMAEVLIVATKSDPPFQPTPVLYINLFRRPQTILDAISTARTIVELPATRKAGEIKIGSKQPVGNYIKSTLANTGCGGVANGAVASAAMALTCGTLHLPQRKNDAKLPVTRLASLGNRGLLHRDINGNELTPKGKRRGPFDIAPLYGEHSSPTYPVLWSHDAQSEKSLIVTPDHRGIERTDCEEQAIDVWNATASRLHFNQDFQINSQPLTACITLENTIGGPAWPNFLCTNAQWEIPLCLWANTTLGLLAFWWRGTRQQSGRARLTLSRLPRLTVLDVTKLTTAQIDHAREIFSAFQNRTFLPANEAFLDTTRQDLDFAILVDLLALPEEIMPPLALLRKQWCEEPSVHGGKKSTRALLTNA